MKIVIYEDLRGEHRWRLVAGNGRIVADGSEGYLDETNARDAVERLLRAFADGVEVD